jgi:hypothetical protein
VRDGLRRQTPGIEVLRWSQKIGQAVKVYSTG